MYQPNNRNIMHAISVIRGAGIKTTPGSLRRMTSCELWGKKQEMYCINLFIINAVAELKL